MILILCLEENTLFKFGFQWPWNTIVHRLLVRVSDQIWKFYQNLVEILSSVQINKKNISTNFVVYNFAYFIDCLYLFIAEINLWKLICISLYTADHIHSEPEIIPPCRPVICSKMLLVLKIVQISSVFLIWNFHHVLNIVFLL
jgi:hypothetical protein